MTSASPARGPPSGVANAEGVGAVVGGFIESHYDLDAFNDPELYHGITLGAPQYDDQYKVKVTSLSLPSLLFSLPIFLIQPLGLAVRRLCLWRLPFAFVTITSSLPVPPANLMYLFQVFLKTVTETFSRDDLPADERRLFQMRNLDRLFASVIDGDGHLRLQLLALRRKASAALRRRPSALVRVVARRFIASRLRDATLAQVDDLRSLVLRSVCNIPELNTGERPRFRKCPRRPDKAAKKFPLREARPRDQLGRLLRKEFTSIETTFLMALVEVLLSFTLLRLPLPCPLPTCSSR